jgi:phosphoenolpyruvate-protein kinase (PTS system EI component)
MTRWSSSGGPTRQEQRALLALSAAHLQLGGVAATPHRRADADHAAIFTAHQELLEDPEVLDRAAAQVRAGDSAAWAWRQAYTSQADRLSALSNAVMRGRATDLRDVGRRVLHLLVGGSAPVDVPADSIVVAEDLTPSDTAALDCTKVRALCTTMEAPRRTQPSSLAGWTVTVVAWIASRRLLVRVVVDGDRGTVNTTALTTIRIVAQQARTNAAVATSPWPWARNHRRASCGVVANMGAVSEGACRRRRRRRWACSASSLHGRARLGRDDRQSCHGGSCAGSRAHPLFHFSMGATSRPLPRCRRRTESAR